MYAILGKIIASIGYSLLTEKLVKHVFIHTAWYLAKKSDNTLDDEWVKGVSEALQVKVD